MNTYESLPIETEYDVANLENDQGLYVNIETTGDTFKIIGENNEFTNVTKLANGNYSVIHQDGSSEEKSDGDKISHSNYFILFGSMLVGTQSSNNNNVNSNICFIGSTLIQTTKEMKLYQN